MRVKLIHTFALICIVLSLNAGNTADALAGPLLEETFLAGFPRTEPGTVDFAGPLVIDLNRDGRMEVLVADSGGCVWGWDSAGNTLANFPLRPSGACGSRNRINSLAAGDIDGDGSPEIVVGTAGDGETSGHRGKVYAWNHNGTSVPGWPREMEWNSAHGAGQPEVYSVALANVFGGPELEVLAGTSNNASSGGAVDEPSPNLYAWSGSGSLLKGFPTSYRRAGIYGLIGAGDLNNDTCMEVLAPRDHRWLHAYNSAGGYPAGWPIETFVDPARRVNAPYVEFTRNAPVVGDLNRDGRVEVIAAGRVKQSESLTNGEIVIINSGVMVFEPDGSRMNGWGLAKLGDGPPLTDGYSPSQAPALGDINGDGQLEIVVTLMDGTVRAFRSDGQQMWKVNYANGRKLFASEPVIGDVNGDGRVDIVFGTYSPDGSANDAVRLVALSNTGAMLSGYPLALSNETGEKKGIRSAPALADLDADGDVEIVAGSWSGVLYVWDLPHRYNAALMPWPTARHDNTRSGYYPRTASLELDPAETAAPTVVDLSAATSTIFLPMVTKPQATARYCQ